MSFIKNLSPIQKRLALLAVAALVVGGVMFFANRHDKPTSGQIKTKDKSSTTSVTAKNSTPGTNENKTTPTDKSSSAGAQGNISGDLAAPSGAFVSNHRPGQNGSSLVEASQCTTTPGAKCYIKFTQNNVVKTLPTKTVDASGSVFWEWSIDDAGITKGRWIVTAVATLGNQTESTVDQLALEVQ